MKRFYKMATVTLVAILLIFNIGTVRAANDEVPIYILDMEDGELLPKKVNAAVDDLSVEGIFKALIEYEPKADEGVNPYFDADVKLIDAKVKNGLLTVNLSDEATLVNTEEQDYHILPIIMLRNTASHIDGVDRIQILINGDDDLSLFVDNIGSSLQNDNDKVYTSDYVVLEVDKKGSETIVVADDEIEKIEEQFEEEVVQNSDKPKEIEEEVKVEDKNKDEQKEEVKKEDNKKDEPVKETEDNKEQNEIKDTDKDVLKLDSKYVLMAASLLVIIVIGVYIINKRK